MRCTTVLCAVALGIGSTAAEAASRDTTWLSYLAPASCEPPPVFAKRVRDRIGSDPEMRVSVTIQEGFVATLRLEDGERIAERQIRGASCDEVVRALALVVAIAHGNRRSEPEPPASLSLKQDPRPEIRAPLARPEREPAPSSRGSTDERGHFGAGAFFIHGPLPHLGGGLSLFGRWALAPFALRAGISAALPQTLRTSLGDASLMWATSYADFCVPVRLATVTLLPCSRLELGGLRSDGAAIANPETALRPWILLGVGAGASMKLSRVLSAGIDTRIGVPLVSHRYMLASGEFAFNTASVVVQGETWVGVSF